MNSNIWFENDKSRQFFEFVAVVSIAIATIVVINVKFCVDKRFINAANKTKKVENAWKHVISDEEVKISRHCAFYTFYCYERVSKTLSQSWKKHVIKVLTFVDFTQSISISICISFLSSFKILV